jgi:hypothetical protein
MNIKCYTLYDITKSNITFRKKFAEIVNEDERKSRSQQSNFETILQIINMRSQPENISEVERIQVDVKKLDEYKFGYLYQRDHKKVKTATVWKFMFSIEHPDAFHNGIEELGNLLADCEQVPMISGLDESFALPPQMNITSELKNIYFEIVK